MLLQSTSPSEVAGNPGGGHSGERVSRWLWTTERVWTSGHLAMPIWAVEAWPISEDLGKRGGRRSLFDSGGLNRKHFIHFPMVNCGGTPAAIGSSASKLLRDLGTGQRVGSVNNDHLQLGTVVSTDLSSVRGFTQETLKWCGFCRPQKPLNTLDIRPDRMAIKACTVFKLRTWK